MDLSVKLSSNELENQNFIKEDDNEFLSRISKPLLVDKKQVKIS